MQGPLQFLPGHGQVQAFEIPAQIGASSGKLSGGIDLHL
jgi:hypothetical protein